MEITIQNVNQSLITLEFLQDLEQGVDDVTHFVKSLEKIKPIINKAGFGNKFTKSERELWNSIFAQVLEEVKPQGLQQLGGDRIYVEENY